MALAHRIKPKYASRNDAIIADLREVAGAAPPMDPNVVAKRKTAEIAIAMALIHGGDWRVQFEPERGLILIARRLGSRPGNPVSQA